MSNLPVRPTLRLSLSLLRLDLEIISIKTSVNYIIYVLPVIDTNVKRNVFKMPILVYI